MDILPQNGMSKVSLCALAVTLVLMARKGCAGQSPPVVSQADDQTITFDNDFLSMPDGKASSHVDLSYFAHRGGMMPGDYQVQVKVNGRVVNDGLTLSFRSWPDSPGKLYACVNANMLSEWGVQSSRQDPVSIKQGTANQKAVSEKQGALNSAECPVGGVIALVPWSSEQFDYNKRILELTVPQASLAPASMMRTSPSRWDEGIPALLLNYNYNGSQQTNEGQQAGSDFLSLNGQLNVLGWRVHNGSSWHKSKNEDGQWNSQDLYAEHDYAMMRGGQLTVGQATSDGSVVDSIPFVGMKMESDSGMLNPEFNSFRPAITGIANSPATVTVRQYGKVIYQQNVPQGPFSLVDFNRSGNGDVEVEVREADGSTRRFSMSSVVAPQLMSKGALGYSMSAGTYRDGGGYLSPQFVQGNASYGVGASVSLLAGTVLSADYQTVSVGGGWYSGMLGAFSLTSAMSAMRTSPLTGNDGRQSGMSHQFSWSRDLGGVAIGFSATRYASRNYHTFSDAQQMTPGPLTGGTSQRASHQISLSRSLGGAGSLSLAGNQTEYWGGQSTQRGYTANYNTTVRDVGIGVSLGYNTYSGGRGLTDNGDAGRNDKSITVNVSIPLGRWLGGSSVSGNYTYSRYNGKANQQAGVSGSTLDDRLNYSVSQGWSDSQSRNTSLGYSGQYASFNGGYNSYGNNHGWTYGMSGAVLVHQHGVTLAKQLSMDGANALIEMPGISGVRVGTAQTDWRGYAVVSGLTPYDLNKVNVDMSNLPGDVELDRSSKNAVPSRGAVVRVRFAGARGYRLLFELKRAGGRSIPFGAVVSLKAKTPEDTRHTGVVGENGQVYMSGLPDKGSIQVQWSDNDDGKCSADYILPPGQNMQRLSQVTAMCS